MRLIVGNLNYSSWSMRPWLGLKVAGIPFTTWDVGLKTTPGWKERIQQFSGAGKVPILVDGALSLHESLAILEYIAELAPEARLWPTDRALRARGRALSLEMASSFQLLRTAMPTNLRGRARYAFDETEVAADLARVREVWEVSLAATGGPYLLGDFSIVDCMFFPVLTRFRTYGVPLSGEAKGYADRVFALGPVQELEQIAEREAPIAEYDAALERQVVIGQSPG